MVVYHPLIRPYLKRGGMALRDLGPLESHDAAPNCGKSWELCGSGTEKRIRVLKHHIVYNPCTCTKIKLKQILMTPGFSLTPPQRLSSGKDTVRRDSTPAATWDKNPLVRWGVQNGSSWWLNQPIWKICSSHWIISPRFGLKIKHIWLMRIWLFCASRHKGK